MHIGREASSEVETLKKWIESSRSVHMFQFGKRLEQKTRLVVELIAESVDGRQGLFDRLISALHDATVFHADTEQIGDQLLHHHRVQTALAKNCDGEPVDQRFRLLKLSAAANFTENRQNFPMVFQY
jgi:hypothetical protein